MSRQQPPPPPTSNDSRSSNSQIPRPTNIIRRDSSSASGTGRPSLLAGLNLPAQGLEDDGQLVPPRPRRLWKVNDTSLKPVPFFYPPLDPRCSVFVSDAPPSVVAVRISECLRKRSVSVEYDEEAVTATCMTVDRCHFVIRLFQGSSRNHPRHGMDMESRPDFSHGLIVEVMRIRGPCISFHYCCRAVLQAALSHSTGAENRKLYQTASNEFPRLLQLPHKRSAGMKLLSPQSKKPRTNSTTLSLEALERVWQNLRKDRLGPQQLAMESLVSLTDSESSGIDTAMQCSLAVLGAPITVESGDPGFLTELHRDWIVKVLQNRVLPNEGNEILDSTGGSCKLVTSDGEEMNKTAIISTSMAETDEHHGGVMRALVLRAFTNALSLVAQEQPRMLQSILEGRSHHLVAGSFIAALLEDLKGSIRPPAVVQGTRLASAHEATLAVRCLGLLGEHSDSAKSQIVNETVLGNLEKARAAGRSTHDILAEEAERAYSQLTEDVRSC